MSGHMMRFTIGLVCVVAVLLSLAEVSEANYKNAPMNGIMFGKRGPTGKKLFFLQSKLYVFERKQDRKRSFSTYAYFPRRVYV